MCESLNWHTYLVFMQEGFNAKGSYYARARIGLITNQENDCESPDSFIGFGTSYISAGARNSAGNFARSYTSPDNGYINTKTVSYIMAR
jgi:hypothetical protein